MVKLFDSLKIKKDIAVAVGSGDHAAAARLYVGAGQPEKALEHFLAAQLYLDAAEIYIGKGDLERAGEMFANEANYARAGELTAKAAATAPEARQKALQIKAASFYDKAGKAASAAELYEKAGNLPRAAALYESGGDWERAARVHAKLGDRTRAVRMLEDGLLKLQKPGDEKLPPEMDPNHPRKLRVWKGLADLYGAAGQPGRAAPYLLNLNQKDKAADAFFAGGERVHAASLWVELNRFEDAARALASETRADALPLQAKVNEHFGRHLEAAQLYEGLKDRAGAARNFEKAGRKAEAAAHFVALGNFARAARLYAEAGEFSPAARAYAEEGETAMAAEMHEKAGEFEPAAELFRRVEMHDRAAGVLVRMGRRAEAIAMLQGVPPSATRYPEACEALGALLVEEGQPAAAAERFEQAARGQRIGPESAKLFYGWADALERAGQHDKARAHFEQLNAAVINFSDVGARIASLIAGGPTPPPGAVAPAPARYRPERQLWTEPLCEVWEGVDAQLSRRVRLYRISGAPAHTARLAEAARAMLPVHHPNIEAVHDIVPGPGETLVVAEALPGESLAARLARGPLPAGPAVEIGRALLRGLAGAHNAKLLHGGLCPERVWLGQDGSVKIGGFGFISRAEESVASRPIASHYITPEQFTGDKLDARADLYLFGLLLKAMLVGPPPPGSRALPWEHTVTDEPDAELARLPAELSAFLTRCLHRRREERFPDAVAASRALEQVGLLPGTVISNRYEVVSRIGTGGMGAIYRVRDRELDEQVALKVLHESAADDETRARFLRELKIARRITHPYIVRVFDLDRIGENLFITMEMVEGVPLTDFVAGGYCRDPRRALDLAVKIAQGMEAAHSQGVVHRDLKPLNILIDRAGNPKILDFGIAKSGGEAAPVAQTELTMAGQIFGSPKYMSPEQCQGQPADGRSDIYSYGLVLYFMFTGREPFDAATVQALIRAQIEQVPADPRTLNPQLPELAARVILACLRKDKAQRPGNFSEIAAVLAQLRQQALAAPAG